MRIFAILVGLSIIFSPLYCIAAEDKELPEVSGEEAELPEIVPEEAGEKVEERLEDVEPEEEFFEEEQPIETPAFEEGTEKEVSGIRKLTIDAVVVVNYTFSEGGESYNVKYHINMGGEIKADIGVIKGNAKIATDIGGVLAKSSAFECLLKVSIADVPYEIMFKKVSDDEADISVTFKGQILEDWESLCTFLDTSGAKFNTRGSPERWIGAALEKAKPSLTRLTTPIDPKKTTILKFAISKYTVQDEGLGSAEIDGTGVVTIEPEKKGVKEGEEGKEEGEEASSFPVRQQRLDLSKRQ